MAKMLESPGAGAVPNINLQNSTVAVFKKPLTGADPKTKLKILTEEKYIEELSKIVQRDFFPDLEKLRAQNDYLEAESNKDYVTMAAIRAKYTGRTPKSSRTANDMSPATFETPVNTKNATPRPNEASLDIPASTTLKTSDKSKTEGGLIGISTKLSLDVFLQHYTSEDNNSFQEIIETAEAKLRQKFAVLYKQEELSAEQLRRALTLPSIEAQFDQLDPIRKIETWNYTNRNSVMYVPDGVNLTVEERVRAAKCKQSIQHSATRLPAVLKHTLAKETTENTVSNSSVEQATPKGSEPKVKGYELLASPRPGEAFSPIMTWGEIEGTPFRLDGGGTPLRTRDGPSFKICENSRRENIAIALADKVGVKMRAQKQKAWNAARKNIGSPFIRSNMDRLASMSPAAQRLATVKFGLSSSTPGTAMFTPSPQTSLQTRRNRITNKNPGITNSVIASSKVRRDNGDSSISSITSSRIRTPKKNNCGDIISKQNIDTGSTLTDDLLQIPTKRRRAKDFF